MSWRQRFDPARGQVSQLRERARRLRDIRALGSQVAALRRVRLSREALVPLVAFLILAATLVLSQFSAPTLDPQASSPAPAREPAVVAELGTATTIGTTPTATFDPALGGYPIPTEVPTSAFLEPTPTVSDTTALSETTFLTDTAIAGSDAGYPLGEGPAGIGEPPDSGFPTFPTYTPPDSDSFPADGGSDPTSAPPQSFPTPDLVPTLPLPSSDGSTDSSDSGSYPAPDDSSDPVPLPTDDVTQSDPSGTDEEFPTSSPDEEATPASGTDEEFPSDPDASTEPLPTDDFTPTPLSTPTPAVTPVPPTPTARSATILSGDLRWTTADSPKVITSDVAVAAGSTLSIDPGVEVQVAPGVRLGVAGTLSAEGVRFVGQGGRWDGIVGTPGSTIVIDRSEVRQAGAGGTAISSTGGALTIRDTQMSDNGGGIVSIGSALDLRNTQITGNAIGGPVVNVQVPKQGGVSIIGNIVGGNSSPAGAPQVLITADQGSAPIAVEGNSFPAGSGVGMVVQANAPFGGTIRCNAFTGGSIGLQLSSRLPDTSGFGLQIDNNAFAGQTNYGAAGSLAFNLANNWWGAPSGPIDARRNPNGRGVPIGVNLLFQPWLDARPACAPA